MANITTVYSHATTDRTINATRVIDISSTEFELPFNNVAVVTTAVLLIFFLLFGFFANLLTIIVIAKSKKLTSIFNQFIMSLCVSDLISALISWITLYRRTWGFNMFEIPNFFCVFYWGADIWTSYVTAQHIVCFAILRLLSVAKPIQFSKIKRRHAKICIATIWVVAFLCGFIPFALFSGAKMRDRSDKTNPVSRWPSCTQNLEWLSQYQLYTIYGYSVFFYVPLVVVTVVSIAIIIVMVKHQQPASGNGENESKSVKRKRKEKQAILQLCLIVGSFMIGYIPFTAFEFYTINSTSDSLQSWRNEWLFGTVQYICLRFSECLNPVFYNLASTKMRGETNALLKKTYNKAKTKCLGERAASRSESRSSSLSGTGLQL